jgi:signal transduction histidine kinase
MRVRVLPAFMGFMVIILISASMTLFTYYKKNMLNDIELRVSNIADEIILNIAKEPGTFFKHPTEFLYPDRENELYYSDMLIEFVDQNGHLIAKSPNMKSYRFINYKGEDDVLSDLVTSNGDKLKVYQRKIDIDGKTIGYVMAGIHTSRAYNDLKSLRNSLTIIMLTVIIMMLLGFRFIAKAEIVDNQRKFLSFASHELRTPLSIISGHAEVALRENNDANNKDALKLIREESVWMNKLISDLLSLFRSEAGVEKIIKKDVNLSEIAVSEATSIKSRYPTKDITMNLPENSTIKADADSIKKILSNLLDNAAKYTKDKGKIILGIENTGKQMIIKVSDNGVGIEKDKQKRIFDPYFRAGQNKAVGMGLGLAITKSAIESHGGSISLVSSPGNGSTFTVTLPIS